MYKKSITKLLNKKYVHKKSIFIIKKHFQSLITELTFGQTAFHSSDLVHLTAIFKDVSSGDLSGQFWC